MLNFRQGYRVFHCSSCNKDWKQKTRDCYSPSGENCPECGDWEFPIESIPDEEVKIDKLGNLT